MISDMENEDFQMQFLDVYFLVPQEDVVFSGYMANQTNLVKESMTAKMNFVVLCDVASDQADQYGMYLEHHGPFQHQLLWKEYVGRLLEILLTYAIIESVLIDLLRPVFYLKRSTWAICATV
ncbi:hypothetical protein TNIN_471401 [Trichonephila inaurata madagascariensis]|uniref:Uncharacterized protein n=1 Tax=Trichonephila inaurata madagascariensis TaxID=2747483 RepID=A0A8X6XMD2_9ARAC|nr:hypothetical protein TNIN_471401 [Trichonephila inaurata madagascariensis]